MYYTVTAIWLIAALVIANFVDYMLKMPNSTMVALSAHGASQLALLILTIIFIKSERA
jgi:hypothetical protein